MQGQGIEAAPAVPLALITESDREEASAASGIGEHVTVHTPAPSAGTEMVSGNAGTVSGKYAESGNSSGKFAESSLGGCAGGGILASVVFNAQTRSSFLLLLSEDGLQEIARFTLPHPVPLSFGHGAFASAPYPAIL